MIKLAKTVIASTPKAIFANLFQDFSSSILLLKKALANAKLATKDATNESKVKK